MKLFKKTVKSLPNNDKGGHWQEVVELYTHSPTESLVEALHLGSVEGVGACTTALKMDLKGNEEKNFHIYVDTYLEFLIFYLNDLDRIVFQELGQGDRDSFIDVILENSFSKAAHYYYGQDRSRGMDRIGEKYNQALSEYASCTSFSPAHNRSIFAKDSSISVLGCRVIKAMNMDAANYIERYLIVGTCWKMVQEFLAVINLKEWVKGPIMAMNLKHYDSTKLIDEEMQKRVLGFLKVKDM